MVAIPYVNILFSLLVWSAVIAAVVLAGVLARRRRRRESARGFDVLTPTRSDPP